MVTGGPISVRDQIGRPVVGIKRINIIRFGDGNDHRPVRAALDVKRLRVNVAHDRAIEVEVARSDWPRAEGVNAGSM